MNKHYPFLSSLILIVCSLCTKQVFANPTIEEIHTMNFGVVTGEDGVCRMKRSGLLQGKSGHSCMGKGQPGVLRLTGTPNAVFQVQVFANETSRRGLEFKPKVVGSPIKTLNKKGKKKITIIGDIKFRSARSGNTPLSYTTQVFYE